MKRREFIAGLGSAAASSLTTRAQRAATKRIGIIINNPGADPEMQAALDPHL
jgi:hypothetical protein